MMRSRLAAALLRLRFDRERVREIQQGLEDLAARRAATCGFRYTRRRYWRDLFSFVAPLRASHTLAAVHRGGRRRAFAAPILFRPATGCARDQSRASVLCRRIVDARSRLCRGPGGLRRPGPQVAR